MNNYIGWYGSVSTFFPDSYGSEKKSISPIEYPIFLYIFTLFWLLQCAVNSTASGLLSSTKCENKTYSFVNGDYCWP